MECIFQHEIYFILAEMPKEQFNTLQTTLWHSDKKAKDCLKKKFNYNLSHIQAFSRMNVPSGIKHSCLFSYIPKLNVANCPSVNLLLERKCKITAAALDLRLKRGLLQPASVGCAKNMRWESFRTGTTSQGILAHIPWKVNPSDLGTDGGRVYQDLKVSLSLCHLRIKKKKIFIGDWKDIISLD